MAGGLGPRHGLHLQRDAARAGAAGGPLDPVRGYTVQLEAPAAEQAAWIQARTGLPIGERIQATLALGPQPHPYRRIRRVAQGMQLAVKEWRVRFRVSEREVRVSAIDSGFRTSQLAAGTDHLLQTHREFLALWPRARL